LPSSSSEGESYSFEGIYKISSSGIILEDEREIEADVMLACIGNGNAVASFPYLPSKYTGSIWKRISMEFNCTAT
jgi:hypothetical protein